ncbi:MAG: arsenate reductase [Candidatus Saganbacteria bacterium]|uniref:Arsenate reductase n=1 Tax=Candidatus Saganbacteria bacterium TaxID=2575572 RepID=A0A833P2Z3_UNCSA|nr:MAG: arsenate reductase [Candidatus Saganbacteria bacterium]
MAEAFANKYGEGKVFAESAGLEPGVLNPLVIEVMKEIGIDIFRNQTKSVFDFYKQGKLYNYVITMCDEAQSERCPIFPGQATKLHWGFEDPAAVKGDYEEKLAKIRLTRNQIEKRIKDWLKNIK